MVHVGWAMDSHGIAHECRPAKRLVSALMALLSVTMSGSILAQGVALGVNNMGKTLDLATPQSRVAKIYRAFQGKHSKIH